MYAPERYDVETSAPRRNPSACMKLGGCDVRRNAVQSRKRCWMATSSVRRRRERKTARMELRVAPSVRRLIERATAISGLAAGDLAYEGARRVLEDHERMVLRGADREAFLKAVSEPPPAPRLVAALRRRHNQSR